jgi:hypothetical protein
MQTDTVRSNSLLCEILAAELLHLLDHDAMPLEKWFQTLQKIRVSSYSGVRKSKNHTPNDKEPHPTRPEPYLLIKYGEILVNINN